MTMYEGRTKDNEEDSRLSLALKKMGKEGKLPKGKSKKPTSRGKVTGSSKAPTGKCMNQHNNQLLWADPKHGLPIRMFGTIVT